VSEPASLVLQCQITSDGLQEWLAARGPRASDWSDWAALDIVIAPHEMADIDRLTAAGTVDFLRRMRSSAERPADWAFSYDPASGMLTIAQVLFTEEWPAIIATLAVLRRLGGFIAPGMGQGLILVQDWIYRQRGTMAAVSLFPGGSAVLAPESLDLDADAFADALLQPIRDAVTAGSPGPIRDDLDALPVRG
jgi:hypothetical protein